MPWNQNNINGWMADQFIAMITCVPYSFSVPAVLTMFYSICKYHDAFYKMFKLYIANINAETNVKPLPIIRIKEMMHESISFQISAKG